MLRSFNCVLTMLAEYWSLTSRKVNRGFHLDFPGVLVDDVIFSQPVRTVSTQSFPKTLPYCFLVCFLQTFS